MALRRFHRIPIEVPVEFTMRDSGQKAHGVAKDISLGGMFVETALPPDFGAAVIVTFTLPGRRKAMVVSGTVRWTSGRGMGVQFGPLGAADTHAIAEVGRAHSSLPPGQL
jgi:uncharacterized protein (TIGR02266 family)